MDKTLLEWARANEKAAIALIREMVEIESPSDDAPALARFAEWFSAPAVEGGHLLREFGDPHADKQILILGHYDTVWPVGTLQHMPFREEQGRLWGPGVLDMKGGIACALMAIRALEELSIPIPARVLLQLNADEETGSRTSRALTERNAQASIAVLVIEPGTGLTGKLKTARKGVGQFRIRVTGRAAHSGVDFENGASAVLELSRQLLKIAEFTELASGVTVNPGVIRGGTRSNVIAAEAEAEIDIRIARLSDAAALEEKFHALKPVDDRCSIEITGGLNRPPMERTDAIGQLFEKARQAARELGIDLEESATGGGSDGNFTAALGIPTLDGLGAVGEGAHAANESILVSRIADRIALLAQLLLVV